MTHSSHSMSAARAACPAHTGLAADIRAVLERSPVPLSAYKLSLMLNIRHAKVMRALTTMISRTGGIVSLPGRANYRLYTIYGRGEEPQPHSKGSGQVAGKITIPQFRYGGTRLG